MLWGWGPSDLSFEDEERVGGGVRSSFHTKQAHKQRGNALPEDVFVGVLETVDAIAVLVGGHRPVCERADLFCVCRRSR